MEFQNNTGYIKENDEKEEVTFDEAMDVVGTGYFQYKVIVVGGVILLTSYITANVIAFVLPVAQCDLRMDSEDKGRLASVFFIGVILTGHLWGFLSDTLGRRYILLRCLFIDGLLYFITMLTPNFHLILFLRFINGITSCGGIVAAYAYIGEFQSNTFRSLSIMIASFFASFSYILMPCVAWLILPAQWQFQLYPGHEIRPWKLFYMLCGVPSLISSVCLYFLPESPKFLLAKGKKEKVFKILEKMYKENHKETDIFPVKSIKINETETIGKIGDNQNKVLAVFKLVWNQTAPLLKKPHRRNMMLLLLSLFATVYCNNGMYVWVPTAINKMEIYMSETGKQEGTYCDVLQYGGEKYKTDYYYNDSDKNPARYVIANLITNILNKTENIYKTSELLKEEGVEEVCNDEVDTSVYFIYLMLGIALTVAWIIVTIINRFANKKYLTMVLLLIAIAGQISLLMTHNLITVPIKACTVIIATGCVFAIINSVAVDLFPTNLRAMAGCLIMLTGRIGSILTHTLSGILIDGRCNIILWLYIGATTVNFLSVSLIPAKSRGNVKETKKLEKTDEEA